MNIIQSLARKKKNVLKDDERLMRKMSAFGKRDSRRSETQTTVLNPSFISTTHAICRSICKAFIHVRGHKMSDVTFDTEAWKVCVKKRNIETLYRSLIRFAKCTWSMTSEASFTWKPRDCFSICFKRSEPQRRLLYIIMHHVFIKFKLTLPMK